MSSRITICIIVFFLFCNNIIFAQEKASCDISILMDKKYGGNEVVADIEVKMRIPKGTKDLYVSFPFEWNSDFSYNLKTSGSNADVLYGFVLPEKRYFVCKVSSLKNDNEIIMYFNNVFFKINPSTERNKNISGNYEVLFRTAFEELMEKYGQIDTIKISNVLIEDKNCVSATPEPQKHDMNILKYNGFCNNIENISVNIKEISLNGIWIAIFVGILGIIIGFPVSGYFIDKYRFIQKNSIFIGWGIVVIIGLVFFGIIFPEKRYEDVTTINIFGGACGLAIGFIINSIQYKKEPSKSEVEAS